MYNCIKPTISIPIVPLACYISSLGISSFIGESYKCQIGPQMVIYSKISYVVYIPFDHVCMLQSHAQSTVAGGLWSLQKSYQANSAFHPSGSVNEDDSAGKKKAGMVHFISGWMRGAQVKLWDRGLYKSTFTFTLPYLWQELSLWSIGCSSSNDYDTNCTWYISNCCGVSL